MKRIALLLAVATTFAIAVRIARSGEESLPDHGWARDLANADGDALRRIAREVHAAGPDAVERVFDLLRSSSSSELGMHEGVPFEQEAAPLERALAADSYPAAVIRYWDVQVSEAFLAARREQRPQPSPVLAIDDARAKQLLGGRDDPARVATCFDGQSMRLVDVTETPYVQDYDAVAGKKPTPLLGCIREGTVATLTPHLPVDGPKEIDVRVEWAMLRRPIPVYRDAVAEHAGLTIQLPEMQLQTVDQRVAIPERGWLLVLPNKGFLDERGFRGHHAAALLHVSLQTLQHHDVPPMEMGAYEAPPADSPDPGAPPVACGPDGRACGR